MSESKVHRFDVDVACDVGVNAAIVFNDICYWCKENESNGKEARLYCSLDDFVERMPYFSKDKVRLAIKKLVDAGYITKGYTFGCCFYEANLSVWEKSHTDGKNPTPMWEKSHTKYINENNIIINNNNNACAREREKFTNEVLCSQIKRVQAMKVLSITSEQEFFNIAQSIFDEWSLNDNCEWSWSHFIAHARKKKRYETNRSNTTSTREERLASYQSYLFSSATGELGAKDVDK